MPRKRSSWGCVQRLDRDRYRIRYWADLGGGYSRHTLTVHGTRREAEARLAELRTEHEREPGEPVRMASKRTVGWYFTTMWEPAAPERYKRRTLANLMSSWRRYVEPAWGDVQVGHVLRPDVQAWLLDADVGMTKNSSRRALSLLRDLLSMAVESGDLDSSPADGEFRLPSHSGEMDKTVLRGDDEFAAYADAVRGTVAEAPFLLMSMAGCRVGESLSPLASDVKQLEVDGMLLAAVRIEQEVDERSDFESLKNDHSARTVAVAGDYGARLLEIADECRELGWLYLADDGTGNPVSTDVLRRVWYKSIAAAGLPRRLMRNLRPSFATSMHWDGDVPLDKLQAMMGHKPGSKITLAHYDRPEDLDVLKARVSAERART